MLRASLLCCPLCFSSTPYPIVSMVSFPHPIGYREGETCLLQWRCSYWLKLVTRLWERWNRSSQVKTCLSQRWNNLGLFFFCVKTLNGNNSSGCHKALSETWVCWEVLSTQSTVQYSWSIWTQTFASDVDTCFALGNNLTLQNTCGAPFECKHHQHGFV